MGDDAIAFDSNLECGNAVDFQRVADGEYSFRIRPDTNSDDRQWFLFRVRHAAGVPLKFHILGTDATNIPVHWEHSLPVASSDGGRTWRHIDGPTSHANNVFTFQHVPRSAEERIAFHDVYGYSEHRAAVARWSSHPAVSQRVLGQSIEGRDIDLLRITESPAGSRPRGIWITCRQHAGETSSSYTLEGFMAWLLSAEAEAVALRRNAVVNLVPMVNPDGVEAGNYRDNIAGVNLNRIWNETDLATCPEVHHIQGAITRWVEEGNRYDLYLDLHSDSEGWCHYCFYAGESMRPPLYAHPERYGADSRRFVDAVARRVPEDFDPNQGASDSDLPGLARTNQMLTHGVMSVIFEAGYGKVLFGTNPGHYLTPARHRAVGRAMGQAAAEWLGIG